MNRKIIVALGLAFLVSAGPVFGEADKDMAGMDKSAQDSTNSPQAKVEAKKHDHVSQEKGMMKNQTKTGDSSKNVSVGKSQDEASQQKNDPMPPGKMDKM